MAAPEANGVESGGLTRLPALDGIRGVAILLVLVYHGMTLSEGAPNNAIDSAIRHTSGAGWMGVDLFFVLSGFLITGILLDARTADRGSSFGGFYGRRFLRIVPVYATLLIALLVAMPLLIPSMRDNADLDILRSNQWWYATFALNIKAAFEPLEPLGRFGNGHLWSVMVEEQFYLVWPFVILLAPKRALLPILLVAIFGAPLLRLALVTGTWPRLDNAVSAFLLMPARMDTLALGGLVAYGMRDPSLWQRLRGIAPVAVAGGTALVVGIALTRSDGFDPFDPSMQVAGFSGIAIAFFGLVVLAIAGSASSPLVSTLAQPMLQFFGKYSYALYVFHYQIMVEVSRQWDDAMMLGSHTISRVAFTMITGALSVAVAWLSWHVIEARALSLKRYFPRTPSALPAAGQPAVVVPVERQG